MVRNHTDENDNDAEVKISAELVAITERWMKAHETKNGRVLETLFSSSDFVRYVGSDIDEHFSGSLLHEEYAKHAFEVPDLHVNCEKIEAFSSGDTGWSIWIGELHFLERNERFPYRFTFIFSMEAGIWKIIHVHISSPRSNIEVMGYEHSVIQQLMQTAKSEDNNLGLREPQR